MSNSDQDRIQELKARMRITSDKLHSLADKEHSEESKDAYHRLKEAYSRDLDELRELTASIASAPPVTAPMAYVQKIRPTPITAADLAAKPKLKFNFADPQFEFASWFSCFQDTCTSHGIPYQESIVQMMNCLDGDAGGESMLRIYLSKEQPLPTTWAAVKEVIKTIFPIPENTDLIAKRFLADTLGELSEFASFHSMYCERMRILEVPFSDYQVDDFLRRVQVRGLRRAIEEAYELEKKLCSAVGKAPPKRNFEYLLDTGLAQIALMNRNSYNRNVATTNKNAIFGKNHASSDSGEVDKKSTGAASAGPAKDNSTSGQQSNRADLNVGAKPKLTCDFCKPDPGTHSTNSCFARRYFEKKLSEGVDRNSIVIPPLSELKAQANLRRLQRQLGDSSTGSSTSGARQLRSNNGQESASSTQFMIDTEEDD